jgi:hypothetical protein
MSDEAIRFTATVSQVRTLSDGGLRIVLDLPETAVITATQMMIVKQESAYLECACLAILPTKVNDDPVPRKIKRNPLYQPKA